METQPDQMHLEEHLRSGRLMVADPGLTAEIRVHAKALPWVGSGLDWGALPASTSINLVDVAAAELLAWLRTTALGNASHVAVVHNTSRPALICSTPFLAENLDLLIWVPVGRRLLFAVSREGQGWRADLRSMAEYDGVENITAVL